jgi:dUTP pyrophosphatase
MVQLHIKRLQPDAVLPKRHTEQDAGIDIYSYEDYTLQPGERHVFATGIAAEFPAGYVALVWDRGSMGSKGVHALGGVIDAGYRGEWKIVLHNLSDTAYEIKKGDRIAQVVLQRYEEAAISEVTQLSDSARASGAFGSSGR